MAQHFIVEGKDGYVLSALCEKQGLGLPIGYTKRSYGDFVINAKGISRISEAIRTALQDEDVTNVGVVVDANDVGLQSRFDSVAQAINAAFPDLRPTITPSNSGWVKELKPGLIFGLWVMPDNQAAGYLEHFLTRLIDVSDLNFILAQRFLAETKATGHPDFQPVRDQKALLALFLSIQDEPGMSPQTAVKKGILKHEHPLAQHFLNWFKATFQLG